MQDTELNKQMLEIYSTYQDELNHALDEMDEIFRDKIDESEGNNNLQGLLMFLQGHLAHLTNNARNNYNNNLYELLIQSQKEENEAYEKRKNNLFLRTYDQLRSKLLQWQKA